MQHKTQEQLQRVAAVYPNEPRPAMTRTQHLERWAELLDRAEELPADLRSRAGEAIDRLIDDIPRRRSAQVFGTCACCHRSERASVAEGAPQCECRFARAVMAPNEMAELCIYFEPEQSSTRP